MIIGRGDYAKDKVILATYGKGAPVLPTERYVYDVTRFRDPAGAKAGTFKGAACGLDPEVQDWIQVDPRVQALITEVLSLTHVHLAGTETYIAFAFVDRQGKWIAPAVAELVADTLLKAGYTVATRHNALDRKDLS